jgi:hypothetical protein
MRGVNPEVPGQEAMQAVLSSADAAIYMGRIEEGRTTRESQQKKLLIYLPVHLQTIPA